MIMMTALMREKTMMASEMEPRRIMPSSMDYPRIQLLITILGVLYNPAVHGDQGLGEVERLNRIDETEKELQGILEVGSVFFDYLTGRTT